MVVINQIERCCCKLLSLSEVDQKLLHNRYAPSNELKDIYFLSGGVAHLVERRARNVL